MGAERAAALARVVSVWRARGLAAATVRMYAGWAARWLAAGGDAGHCDRERFVPFLAALRGGDAAPSTINAAIKAVRAYYAAAVTAGVAIGDQAGATRIPRRVPTPNPIPCRFPAETRIPCRDPEWMPQPRRVPERIVPAYDIAEVRQLLAAPDPTTWLGRRDRVLLRTLYETGLRAGELARLEVGAVLAEGWILVRAGKGGRDRYVPIGAGLQAALAAWERDRVAAGPRKRGALFVSRTGRPLGGAGAVWRIVRRYARACLSPAPRGGPARPWQGHYPHRLRASIATHLRQGGMPINAIAEVLGHTDLATTARYVAVDLEAMREGVKMHPRNRRNT